ncbi:hypothetical protein [Priestia aryabhattai]
MSEKKSEKKDLQSVNESQNEIITLENLDQLIIKRSQTLKGQVSRQSFDEMADDIELSEEEKKGIKKRNFMSSVGSALVNTLGGWLNPVIGYFKGVDKDISNAKKNKMLTNVVYELGHTKDSMEDVVEFLSSPEGAILANMSSRILDNYPPDSDKIAVLSKVLANIIKTFKDEKFSALFEKHKYALSQIERLTPQALVILANSTTYPDFPVDTDELLNEGSVIRTEWCYDFSRAFCNKKGIDEPDVINRVNHSIMLLIQEGYIQAYKEGPNTAKCKPTTLGSYLLTYLDENSDIKF